MSSFAVVLITIIVISMGVVFWRLVVGGLRYGGRMVVVCPENQRRAGVSIDFRHAFATSLSGSPELRLQACSRWPERAGCGQSCLGQIENSPEDCLVRNLLVRWYKGKDCAWCGNPIGEIHFGERRPAVLLSGRESLEWAEIPAENLQETLATALPLCFRCHIANTMIRKHPELVIDRGRSMVSGAMHGSQTVSGHASSGIVPSPDSTRDPLGTPVITEPEMPGSKPC